MATASDVLMVPTASDVLEILEKKLQCPICLKNFTQPKLFPCLHAFCKNCLGCLPQLHQGDGYVVKCPICRSPAKVPEDGISGFPNLFHFSGYVHLQQILKKIAENQQVTCKVCNENQAQGFCQQCEDFVCQKCIDAHHKMKVFADHEIISINELIIAASHLKPIKRPSTLQCPKHKRPLTVYCHSPCDKLICYDCTVCDHKDHECNPISDKSVFMKYKQEIDDNLLPTKRRLTFMLHRIETFSKQMIAIAENRDKVKEEIQATGDRMIEEYSAAVRQSVGQLKKKADTGAEEKLRFMSAQKEDAQTTAAMLHSCVEYVEGELRMGFQQQILAGKTQMVEQMKVITSQVKEEEYSLTEEPDIKIIKRSAKNTDVGDIEFSTLVGKCKLSMEGITTATKGEAISFQLAITPNSGSAPISLPISLISCQLSVPEATCPNDCNITEISLGKYEVSYTPVTIGPHQLRVRVGNVDIPGSPFTVQSAEKERQVEELQQQIQLAQQQLAQKQDWLAQQQSAENERQVEELQHQIQLAHQQSAEKERQVDELQQQLTMINDKMKIMKKILKSKDLVLNELHLRVEASEGRVYKQKEIIVMYESKITELGTQMQTLARISVEKDAHIAKCEATLKSSEVSLIELTKKQNEISQLKKQLEKVKEPAVTQDTPTQTNYLSVTGAAWSEFPEENKELQQQIQLAQQQSAEKERQVEELQQQLTKIITERTQLDLLLKQRKDELENLEKLSRAQLTELDQLQLKVKASEDARSELAEKKDSILSEYESQMQAIEDIWSKLAEEKKELQQQIQLAQQQSAEKERQVEELQQQLTETNAERTQLECLLEKRKDELQMAKKISRATCSEIDQLRLKVKASEEKNNSLKSEYESQVQAAQEAKRQCEELVFENSKLKQELEESQMPLAKMPAVTHDSAVQANYLSAIEGPLMEELASTVLEITGGKHQTHKWAGNGFRLTVPAGAVPEGTTISLAVRAFLAENFDLPENSQLISAIYWIAASQRFDQEVILHLQHCALIKSEAQCSQFKFVAGRCSQPDLPYLMKKREGGVFTPHSLEASISVKQFSYYGIVHEGDDEVDPYYYGQGFYQQKGQGQSWILDYTITCYLESLRTWVKEKYESEGWTQHHEQLLQFDETASNSSKTAISLRIAKPAGDKQNNWEVSFVSNIEFTQWIVDRITKNSCLPFSRIGIEWTGLPGNIRSSFVRKIDLSGMKGPHNYFEIFLPEKAPPTDTAPTATSTSTASPTTTSTSTAAPGTTSTTAAAPTTTSTSTTAVPMPAPDALPDGSLDSGHLPAVLDYLEKQGIVDRWKRIGVILNLPYKDMQKIEGDYSKQENCVMAMLNQWLTSGTASKQILLDALKKI